jgi:hypothetical protein
MQDYKNVPEYLIDYMLDIYAVNGDFFKNLNKKMKKLPKEERKIPITKEIKGIEIVEPHQDVGFLPQRGEHLEKTKDGIIQPIKLQF